MHWGPAGCNLSMEDFAGSDQTAYIAPPWPHTAFD